MSLTRIRRIMLAIYRMLPAWLAKWAVYALKRKYVIGVVGIVPNERGECLFLRHTYRRKRPWRLPGGLKERREAPFVTIVRELMEEANVTVRPLQVVDVNPSDVTLDITILCELEKIDPFVPNEEIDDLMWVDPHRAPFEIPVDQLQVIDCALQLRARLRG